MISIEKSTHINKPIKDVFAFVSDISNNPKWQSGVVRSEKTSAGPIGLGSTGILVQKRMGQEMKNEMVVTAFEAPTRFAGKTTSGPVTFEYEMDLEDKGDGTQVTVKTKGEAGGFFKVAEAMLQKDLDKSFDENLAKLKQILEA